MRSSSFQNLGERSWKEPNATRDSRCRCLKQQRVLGSDSSRREAEVTEPGDDLADASGKPGEEKQVEEKDHSRHCKVLYESDM